MKLYAGAIRFIGDAKKKLNEIINSKEDDVRYYNICNKDKAKILIDGKGTVLQEVDYYLL